MKILSKLDDQQLIADLRSGALAVLRTDTLYGLVASAFQPAAVEKIYQLKQRQSHKACIVLMNSAADLLPGTQWTPQYQQLADKYWPGPTSLIVPVDESAPVFIHRGTHSIAYRMPDNVALQTLLRQTGPLVAPSANIEGQPPAHSIPEAIDYFGDAVDYYIDGGFCDNVAASQIITLDKNNQEHVIRA